MRRTVTVTIEVDPEEYTDVGDTDEETVDLVLSMLRNDADLPDTVTISCGRVFRSQVLLGGG